MALATLHIAAIPIAAGLLVGTGAVTAYVASPAQTAPQAIATAAAPVATQASRPCAEQTWPYIDQKCIASAGTRTVRLISAPRGGEAAGDTVSSNASAAAARAAEPGLVTGDTVLRQPQPLAAPAIEPDAQVAKPRAKRSETRRQRDRRWDAQSYQVPSEFQGRGARPVIVVRPLRLEAFR